MDAFQMPSLQAHLAKLAGGLSAPSSANAPYEASFAFPHAQLGLAHGAGIALPACTANGLSQAPLLDLQRLAPSFAEDAVLIDRNLITAYATQIARYEQELALLHREKMSWMRERDSLLECIATLEAKDAASHATQLKSNVATTHTPQGSAQAAQHAQNDEWASSLLQSLASTAHVSSGASSANSSKSTDSSDTAPQMTSSSQSTHANTSQTATPVQSPSSAFTPRSSAFTTIAQSPSSTNATCSAPTTPNTTLENANSESSLSALSVVKNEIGKEMTTIKTEDEHFSEALASANATGLSRNSKKRPHPSMAASEDEDSSTSTTNEFMSVDDDMTDDCSAEESPLASPHKRAKYGETSTSTTTTASSTSRTSFSSSSEMVTSTQLAPLAAHQGNMLASAQLQHQQRPGVHALTHHHLLTQPHPYAAAAALGGAAGNPLAPSLSSALSAHHAASHNNAFNLNHPDSIVAALQQQQQQQQQQHQQYQLQQHAHALQLQQLQQLAAAVASHHHHQQQHQQQQSVPQSLGALRAVASSAASSLALPLPLAAASTGNTSSPSSASSSSGNLSPTALSASDSGRRGHLPEHAIRHLKSWFFAHKTHPYPSEDEKNVLMDCTGLSRGQINNWFTNARRRLLPKSDAN